MNSDQRVESLLQQMKLREPSGSLDEKIDAVCHGLDLEAASMVTGPATFGRNRGWAAFVATALVASLIGFVIGQWVTLDSNLGTRATSIAAAVTEVGKSNQVMQGNLTPVKFNVNAFRLLHGHSQKDEFGSCKQCHTGELDETAKAFQGWFYGDSQFFRKHGQSDVSKCSNCHKLDSVEEPLPKFEHFKDSNCSTCHVMGKTAQKKPTVDTES